MLFRLSGVKCGWLLGAILSIITIVSQAQAQQKVVNGRMIISQRPGMVGAFTQAANSLSDVSLKDLGSAVLATKSSHSVDPTIQAAQADEFVDINSAEAIETKKICESFPGTVCEFDQQVKVFTTPNDPKLGQLYGMTAIDAPRAWDRTTGNSNQVVAIIDTGIDYTHQDLSANVWTNPNEIAGNGIDDDGNGYVDDIHGWNAFSHTGNPYDDNGHGTHVAGTIGGAGNNGLGVVGVNWNVKIMGLKFLSSNGSGSLSGAIEAINYMNKQKDLGVDIRVCNNSWGGGSFSQALYNAISAANDRGIVFAAAAGNESNDNDANPSYPAGYLLPNVVSVAAVDQDNNLAYFSNYGATTVHLAAPGVSIISTYPGNQYESLSGTSMATPHVTGAFALLFASEPGLSANQAIERMLGSTVAMSSLTGVVKTGMLNIGRAVYGETSPIVAPPQAASCVYEVGSASSAAIDAATIKAFGEQIVAGTDEYNFGTHTLEGYTIDNVSVSQVKASPNGVLYFKNVADTMDYKPGKDAPVFSLATQTDLVSSVYAYTPTSDPSVTYFLWEGTVYGNASLETEVIMAVHSNGTMEQYILKNNSVASKQMTMGFTTRDGSGYTYARNSAAALAAGTSVKYTPHCGDGFSLPAKVDKVKVIDVTGHNEVTERFAVQVKVSNFSSATTSQLQIGLGNKFCPSTLPLTLSQEKTRFSGRIPRSLGRTFRSLKVKVGERSDSVRLSGSSIGRRSVSEAAFNNGCNQLFRSIRAR